MIGGATLNQPSTAKNTANSLSLKQCVGKWLVPRLPVNKHVFGHIRLELNAIWVRLMLLVHPRYRWAVSKLRVRRKILANLGCGPFGLAGWVNLDLFPHENVTLRCDCRWRIPLADGSCAAIHVEHFFEHLNHEDERHEFLSECRRCLEDGGVLRIIVPDAELFVRAYLAEGWEAFQNIAPPEERPEQSFITKMDALNHVFLQGFEHYGGYDRQSLAHELISTGFFDVRAESFRQGRFPGGCIDREQHRQYSLYMEAVKQRTIDVAHEGPLS